MEAELRKHSGESGEKNGNLSLRMKRNDAKAGHDELVEKLEIKNQSFLPLWESLRGAYFDAEDIEEETNEKH